MINNNHVTPVGLNSEPVIYDSHSKTKDEIEEMLKQKGVYVSLGSPLKGGVVSQVYAGSKNKQPVVVKYTSDAQDSDPTVYFMPHETQYVDNKLLKFLGKEGSIKVPNLHHSFASMPISVMEDLRTSGFILFSQQLRKGNLHLNCSTNVGRDIAKMQHALAKHPVFMTALSGPQIYYSRGQELRQSYHSGEKHYEQLFDKFTKENQQLSVVDTHPKNMFVNKVGKLAWIDFGCSAWADRDFALPNFLSHIGIYYLSGYLDREDTLQFIMNAINGYTEILPLDENSFCKYFAAEIIHRWSGKWVEGIESRDQKLTLLRFGMEVFDSNITSIKNLLELMRATEPGRRTDERIHG